MPTGSLHLSTTPVTVHCGRVEAVVSVLRADRLDYECHPVPAEWALRPDGEAGTAFCATATLSGKVVGTACGATELVPVPEAGPASLLLCGVALLASLARLRRFPRLRAGRA